MSRAAAAATAAPTARFEILQRSREMTPTSRRAISASTALWTPASKPAGSGTG